MQSKVQPYVLFLYCKEDVKFLVSKSYYILKKREAKNIILAVII